LNILYAKKKEQIARLVNEQKGDRLVTVDNVLNTFDELRQKYKLDGELFDYYLTLFAGKDLLAMMEVSLKELGFKGASHLENYMLGVPVNSILLGVVKLYFRPNGMLPVLILQRSF
jgi:hypothetical protein